MNLSDNLKKIRKENNLSQEQLAEKLGVSRQSVSKWESNQAYPEMNKVIEICNMFNLNIDELLNQNISEIKEKKEYKNNVNKFIDSFLNYITKSVDMFSSMNFKEKLKCLGEQAIVIFIIALFFLTVGGIATVIINSLLGALPYQVYTVIYNILVAFYILFALILGTVIFLHIFKTRYLDYYVVVKGDKNEENVKGDSNVDNNINLEKNSEKIIIRDPKHSSYKFISILFKCVLFLIKIFTLFIGFGLLFALVTVTILLVLSFLFIKTGITFIGSLVTLLSSILIILVLLYIIYSFIFNKKIKINKVAIIFIISVITASIGIGLFITSLKDYDYIDTIDNKYYIDDVINIEMNDEIMFDTYYDVEYIESDNTSINIVCTHSKHSICEVNEYNNILYINTFDDNNKLIEYIRDSISDINKKQIIDYFKVKVTVYTTKENIKKIENNKEKYIQYRNNYEDIINDLAQELYNKNSEINELKEQLNVYEKSNAMH